MDKFKMPKDVEYILDTLDENGYEGYIVGGCVRDKIMGITPADWDITTSALPEQTKELFDNTFDTGIEHGTITVVLNKENYEITTYRIDGEYLDNRRPEEVYFTSNLKEDVERRDFTINAIAYNHKEGYKDYFNGIEDIYKKIIRGVGDPDKRFQEDALRMIRAIRFAGKTGFDIEDNTYNAIKRNKHLFASISVERVREEFVKLLYSPNPDKLYMIIDTRLLEYYDSDFYNYLEKNIDDIVGTLEKLKEKGMNSKDYAVVALFKNMTEKETVKYMKDFKFSNAEIKETSKIVDAIKIDIAKNPYDVRKFISKYSLDLSYKAFQMKKIIGEDIDYYMEIYNEVVDKEYPIAIKDLAINGNDLQEVGIKGKEIGQALGKALDYVLRYPDENIKSKLMTQIK